MKLDNVTLVSIVGNPRHLDDTKKAIRHCIKQVDFDKTILLSCEEDSEFQTHKIPYLDVGMYNNFCIKELTNYIDTEFCLVIQSDGYIIDTDYWTNDFLDYDYIGCPWASWGYTIGNGGFSLRSKKFLDASSSLEYFSDSHIQAGIPSHMFLHGSICAEDFFLCYLHKEHMVKNGIKFPSPELAYQFSVEHQDGKIKQFNPEDITTYKSFGFHGKFNTAAMKEIKE